MNVGSVTLALEMAYVLYLDLVGDGSVSADEKRRVARDLELLATSTAECDRARKKDQLSVQSGDDGLALLFFGDLEAPIRCAVELARALPAQAPGVRVRMGAHAGPAYREALSLIHI